ncbi:TetR/AcrR family transcriptional regulator [Actinospongicola halichondriae]|uniref:TetR/AcrR family transcriptional regulator n=1 Tax=Actinospongicola halichondriae TaxID=3236844 RepID=UPI003D50D2A5
MASIAARAGVGVGSLYRRYPTKQALLQHLCLLSLKEYLAAAESGLAASDPWDGLAQYVTAAVRIGTGSLGPIAGTIEVTTEMSTISAQGDAAASEVIQRARTAQVLRPDVNDVDIALLIEQLGRSPLVEQIARQGRTDLLDAAEGARERLIRLALDGLRAAPADPLPGPAPQWELFTERWARPDHAGRSAT